MYSPRLLKKLVHPQTTATQQFKHPLRIGLRNSIAGLVPVLVVAAALIWNYQQLSGTFAWWILALIPVGIVIVAIAHAYLGSLIGGRRANNVFLILLLVVLVTGCWLLTEKMGGDR